VGRETVSKVDALPPVGPPGVVCGRSSVHEMLPRAWLPTAFAVATVLFHSQKLLKIC